MGYCSCDLPMPRRVPTAKVRHDLQDAVAGARRWLVRHRIVGTYDRRSAAASALCGWDIWETVVQRGTEMANDSEGDEFMAAIAAMRVDEASRRVMEKTGGAKCPFCGTDTWFVETGGDLAKQNEAAPAFVLKDPRGFWGASPSFPVAVFSCSNCGFVRLHNVTVVNDGR